MNNFSKLMRLHCLSKSAASELIRFIFYGKGEDTGAERTFFIELALINPTLSPNKVILGYKGRAKPSSEDIQNILLASEAARSVALESAVTPSYITVRLGVLGLGTKQLAFYTTRSEAQFNIKSFWAKVKSASSEATFSLEKLSGHLERTLGDITAQPELFSDAGEATWDLSFRVRNSPLKTFRGGVFNWDPAGAVVDFSGTLKLDGVSYKIGNSSLGGQPGSIEHFWGGSLPSDWFHLSATKLISVISGRPLDGGYFTIQGVYDDRVNLLTNIGGKTCAFIATDSKRHYNALWDVTEAPSVGGEGSRVHYSCSIHSKGGIFGKGALVFDVDIFSVGEESALRRWEDSRGGRQLHKILSSGTALGEIKVYHRVKKDLVLIEQARAVNAIAEYGQVETTI